MTQLEYFRLLAPEFASVDDSIVQTWLGMAGLLSSTGCLDAERAAMAVALYAAHMLLLSQKGSVASAAGPLISEKEGDLQRTYAAPAQAATAASSDILSSTNYGRQYIDITRACFGSAIMTRGAL